MDIMTPSENMNSFRSKENKTETDDEVLRQRIKEEVLSYGIPCIPEILEPLMVLEKESKFNNDSRSVVDGIKSVLTFEKSFNLGIMDQKRLFLAAYIDDIGKASSSRNPECRLAVVRLFSKENIRNREITVDDFVKEHFPNEKNMLENLLKVSGIRKDMSMLDFHNMHIPWMEEILEKCPQIDLKTRKFAASHHLDRNINPYNIDISKLPIQEQCFLFLLMAMDKYQAARRRGKLDHAGAMKRMSDDLKLYGGNVIMESVKKAIDTLGSISLQSLFPKTYTFFEEVESAETKK